MTIRTIPSSPAGRAGIAAIRAMLATRDDAATPLVERRAGLEAFAAQAPMPSGVTATEEVLGGRPALRIAPLEPRGRALFLHGGAYVLGSARSHAGLAARYALASGATFYVLDYRLAPEHPYPAALDDALAAYEELAGGKEPLALVGDSAGGGLSLALAVALRDRQAPAPVAVAITSPWCDLTLSGESMTARAGEEIMLSRAGLAQDADRYRGDRAAADPAVSPLFAELAGLPPSLIQVGTHEVLLDDARRLHDRLEQAGVAVTLELWDDMGHAWAASGTAGPNAAQSIRDLGAFLRRVLAG
jgi:epsilon-lactone hydrolase